MIYVVRFFLFSFSSVFSIIDFIRFHNQHTTQASADRTIEDIPLGRAGTPEDIARAICFLASEYDGFISGATLDINGGIYRA